MGGANDGGRAPDVVFVVAIRVETVYTISDHSALIKHDTCYGTAPACYD